MPIRVQGPDGAMLEFPDGTDRETMKSAMRKRYGEPKHQRSGLIAPGNIDLTNRPRVRNADGSISTVRSMSANFDGREVLIPTVSDDGRILSDDQAIEAYRRTGRHLGMFSSPEAATRYAEQLHRDQERMYASPQKPRSDFSGVKASVSSTERIASAPGATKVEQPAAPRRGNAATQFLGDIGARQVMQGVGGLFGSLGGDALNEYVADPLDRALGLQDNKWLRFGTGGRSYRQVGSDVADAGGMAAPQTATQRVVSDIGEGLSGTALTMGVGGLLNLGRQAAQTAAPTVASRIGDFLTAQPVLQGVSTVTGTGAGSIARESGAGQGTQAAASVLGALAPGGASYATGAGLRGLVRGRDGTQMQQTIDDFAKLGATPSVGQASGNRMVQGAENLLAGGPTSAGVMGRFAEKQAEQIGAGLQQQGESLMRNASGERAGRAIERGADLFARNVRAMRNALYWQADRQIPQSTVLPLARTRQALDSMTTPTPGAENTTRLLINPKLSSAPSHHSAGGIREALEADIAAAQQQGMAGIPYSAARDLRSRIGRELEDFTLSADKPTAEYRRLYAALSADLEDAAKRAGPDAERAMRRANNYFKASADRLATIERVIDRNGGPERVYGAVMAGTRDGGTTLRAVMQSLPQEGQKAVTAAVIKRMGLATSGAQDAAGDVFSAQTFLTNWNKVSPEAKRALFDRYGPQFSKDMDRVARVAQTIKQSEKMLANASGTANRAAAMTYGATLVASLFDPSLVSTGAVVGGGVGANVSARLLTNPRVVRYLASVTALPKGSIPGVIQSMRKTGEKDQDEDLIQAADLLAAQQP